MRTLQVGPNSQYKSIKTLPALLPGDVVEVEPGIYHDARVWPIAGTPDEPITVRSMEPRKAIFDAEGINLQFTPRAIFQVPGGVYRFLDFKFRNASNNANAAAIRVIAGQAEVVGNHIRNCDMGVQTTNANLMVIRHNDIGWNGRGANSHNIYLSGGEHSIIEDNIIARTIGGMNVKVRTRLAEIRHNQILDSVDGEIHATYSSLTLQPGSDCIVEGNFIRTLAKGRTNKLRVIAFGHEGSYPATDRNGTLFLRNNRIEMRDPQQIMVSLDSVNAALDAEGNSIEGSCNLIRVRYGSYAGNEGRGNRIKVNGQQYEFDACPLVFFPPPIPPVDTTPPAPPSDLIATQMPTSVKLTWSPSPSTDVDHYEVIGPYGPFSMGDECAYAIVAGLYVGRSYTYSVVAVDPSGNASKSSTTVTFVRTVP